MKARLLHVARVQPLRPVIEMIFGGMEINLCLDCLALANLQIRTRLVCNM